MTALTFLRMPAPLFSHMQNRFSRDAAHISDLYQLFPINFLAARAAKIIRSVSDW